MLLALDPEIFRPPRADGVAEWVRSVRELAVAAGHGAVALTCPKDLQDEAVARWYSGGAWRSFGDSPITPEDLLRVVEELRGRSLADPLPAGFGVLFDEVTLTPGYCSPELQEPQREVFREHVGVCAFAQSETGTQSGVLSTAANWQSNAEHIAVMASVALLSRPGEGEVEPQDEDAGVHEHIDRLSTTGKVLEALAEDPCRLIEHLELGIRCFWLHVLGGELSTLSFEIGPDLEQSITGMNYRRNARYATACLRVMALIAGGRHNEVPGHAERAGAGGNNPVVTIDGCTVYRSYLAQRSPDAHRLFWVRTNPPRFLNVGGHDASPLL